MGVFVVAATSLSFGFGDGIRVVAATSLSFGFGDGSLCCYSNFIEFLG